MTVPDRPARPWDLFNKNIEKVTAGEAAKRLEICEACPHLVPVAKTCTQCGCFMTAKVKLPHAECPLGKWGRIAMNVSITEEN